MRYVHALAKPIIALDDHFAQIDADANIDPLVFRQFSIALGETSLKRRGGFDRVYNASECRKQAIAGQLENAAVMLLYFGLEELCTVRAETIKVPASSPFIGLNSRRHPPQGTLKAAVPWPLSPRRGHTEMAKESSSGTNSTAPR